MTSYSFFRRLTVAFFDLSGKNKEKKGEGKKVQSFSYYKKQTQTETETQAQTHTAISYKQPVGEKKKLNRK